MLNAPLVYGLLSMAAWVIASLVMSTHFYFELFSSQGGRFALVEVLRVGFGIILAGIATSSIVYFMMEANFRRIRPLFFPDGGLVRMRRVFRLDIRSRLLFAFMMVSVGPMIVVGVVFHHKVTSILTVNPEQALDSIRAVIFYVPAVLIVLAAVLSRLVASSIAGPIAEMEDAMARVSDGDFAARVKVTDNDELGVLADSFNHMTEGLWERENMRHSLALAQEVQQNLLPERPPELPGLDLAGRSQYCDETGGDYYDFLEFGGDTGLQVGLVVGDVSDHGLPSALLMTTARAFLRQRASLGGSLQEMVSDVNRQLIRDVAETGRFMTLFLCRLDLEENTLGWVSAGHDPAQLYDPRTGLFDELGGRSPALGLMNNFSFQEYSRPLQPGQVLMLGTDGLWEAADPQGNMYGKDRLRQLLKSQAHRDSSEIVAAVLDELNRFVRPGKFADDVTLVVAKVREPADVSA